MIKREAAAYLIAGAITTLINMVVYHLGCDVAGISNLPATALAWVAAVIFAYFANDIFVFTSTRCGTWREQAGKMGRFFCVRMFSLLVDMAGMFLLVDILEVNNMFAKVAMNVIIVVLNYVLSKFFIFRK